MRAALRSRRHHRARRRARRSAPRGRPAAAPRRCWRCTSRRRSASCCARSTRTPTTITPSGCWRRRAPRSTAARPTGEKGVRLLREVIGELGPAAAQLRPTQRLGPRPRQPHHRRRDGGAAAHAVPRSAHRARRSCSRCRSAASTAPPATGSRARWPPSASAPRPARCTASRACPGWSATARTWWCFRSWWRACAGGSLARRARRAGRVRQRDDALRVRGARRPARQPAGQQQRRHRLRDGRRRRERGGGAGRRPRRQHVRADPRRSDE